MITLEEIQKVAALSKLRFSDDNMQVLRKDLGSILKMMDELMKIDCTGIEPLTSVLDMKQILRDDEVETGDISNEILNNAPGKNSALAKEIKCFIVPKVIE